MNAFNILKERGYIAQLTHENEIKNLLENEKINFYIGFDPTADSLHVGHFLQMMVMSHMQKAGHVPIVVIGSGTTMIGDPSDKTDMRKMLSKEEIFLNAQKFKYQLSHFIDFEEGKAIMIDNSEWLMGLNYIEFLREVGVHFSVNRMLSAECFKSRLEKGLSFIEFNYMLMQSYDFLKLFQNYNCKMELGGDDQWSNIIGGIELIRRIERKQAYGMTFNLLTTSEGKKMGKTEKGALWLDEAKTSPYDFYQYWRNIHDSDVIKCLKLLTFLPIEEINSLENLKDQEINKAKKILAYEVTKLIHGEEEAIKANNAATSLFEKIGVSTDMPSSIILKSSINNGLNIIDLILNIGIIPSKSEGRRLISQGGLFLNDNKIDSIDFIITLNDFIENKLIIKKGKKTYHKIKLI